MHNQNHNENNRDVHHRRKSRPGKWKSSNRFPLLNIWVGLGMIVFFALVLYLLGVKPMIHRYRVDDSSRSGPPKTDYKLSDGRRSS